MYFDPKMIIDMLQEELGLSYQDIIKHLNNATVIVKERDIKRFLDSKYYDEKPGVKEKVETLNNRLKNRKKYGLINNPNYFSEKFSLYVDFDKYKFEPYTLEYFKNYISILRNKCDTLLKIIEGIIDGTIPKYVLEEFDIELNDDNLILSSDMNRLIKPFIYNFVKLNEVLEKANDLNTYLDYKVSLDYVYSKGLSENDIYPKDELQNSYYEFDGEDGFIPYTDKQKKLIKKKENEIMRYICDAENNLK